MFIHKPKLNFRQSYKPRNDTHNSSTCTTQRTLFDRWSCFKCICIQSCQEKCSKISSISTFGLYVGILYPGICRESVTRFSAIPLSFRCVYNPPTQQWYNIADIVRSLFCYKCVCTQADFILSWEMQQNFFNFFNFRIVCGNFIPKDLSRKSSKIFCYFFTTKVHSCALYRFYVLQATESWAGPGNEASVA